MCQPGTTQSIAAPDTLDSMHDKLNPGNTTTVINPVGSDSTNELQVFSLVHTHPQENARPPDSSLENGTTRIADCGPPLDPLANITDEPAWMKKKRTLKYFREAPKLGCLSDVIQHWYQLEESLGFQNVVSFCNCLTLHCAHDFQTPLGFPVSERPPVICLFHKNAHNYKKDYSVEVCTLGRQIMKWWRELCPPGEPPKVQFGGPTGICTLIVLLSWWCAPLVTKSGGEQADYLRTLADVDHALLEAIDDIRRHPATSTPTPLPPASTLKPRKRGNSTGTLPRKRARSTRGE